MRIALIVGALSALSGVVLGQQRPDSAARRQERALDSLTSVVRALEVRIDSLLRAGPTPATPPADELAAIRAAAAAATADTTAQSQPQQARLGQNALNPEISVTGDL